jgi:hypothetical protein
MMKTQCYLGRCSMIGVLSLLILYAAPTAQTAWGGEDSDPALDWVQEAIRADLDGRREERD